MQRPGSPRPGALLCALLNGWAPLLLVVGARPSERATTAGRYARRAGGGLLGGLRRPPQTTSHHYPFHGRRAPSLPGYGVS